MSKKVVPDQILYTPEQAGAIIGGCRQEIYNLVNAGELKPSYKRGALRIHRIDLEAYAKSLRSN